MFIVFDAQGVQSGVQFTQGGALTESPVLPGVDHQLFVHPDARTIVHSGCELIKPRRQSQGACPAHRKVVCGQSQRRTARAPVKINRRVVAIDDRRAEQKRVVEICAAPIGKRHDRFPPECNLCPAHALVVFHADHVFAAEQIAVADTFARTSVPPIVYDELPVHVHAYAVVGESVKAIRSRRQSYKAGPAHREVVCGKIRCGG